MCGGGDGFIAGVNIFFINLLVKIFKDILAGRVLHAGVSDTPCVGAERRNLQMWGHLS